MERKSHFRYVALPLAVVLTVYALTQDLPWTSMRIAGMTMMLLGFVLWGIAHVQLGDSFSVRPEARQLVTHGIYSRIRNPIYVFSAIAIAGAALTFEKPLWLLVFVVILPLQLIRSRREARVLEDKFGEQYREYARHTWF